MVFYMPGRVDDVGAGSMDLEPREIVEELDHEIASPDDVRDMLGLKGMDKVNF